MFKPAYSTILAALLAVTLTGCSGEDKTAYTVCEGTYALCTTAPCQPIAGKEGTVACACEVKTGYSLGMEPCQSTVDTSEGKQIVSRYFPIKSYASLQQRPALGQLPRQSVHRRQHRFEQGVLRLPGRKGRRPLCGSDGELLRLDLRHRPVVVGDGGRRQQGDRFPLKPFEVKVLNSGN